MTPGIVVSLRVNPTDVMAVIDTLSYLGIPSANLSFNQATKLVLSASLESHRQAGIIPRRGGFEYSEMLEPFQQQGFGARGRRLQVAKLLAQPTTVVPPVETPERRARKVRYEELLFRRNEDPMNFNDADLNELASLMPDFQ